MEVTTDLLEEIKNYLNVFHKEDDMLIKSLATAGIEYIKDYTGLTTEEVSEKQNSLKVALFLICAEGYDYRGQAKPMYKQNLLLTSILNLHSKNYL